MNWQVLPDRESASMALAQWLAERVKSSLKNGMRSRLALSGGTTPETAYRAFAAFALPWDQVDIALVDDRWVGSDQEGSNERLIRACFTDTRASIFGLVSPVLALEEGAAAASAKIAALRPFDAIILGLGLDGHTASYFPAADGLARAMDADERESVVAIHAQQARVAAPWPERVTLSLPVIVETPRVALLAFGTEKRALLESNAPDLPIDRVKAAVGDRLSVFWAP